MQDARFRSHTIGSKGDSRLVWLACRPPSTVFFSALAWSPCTYPGSGPALHLHALQPTLFDQRIQIGVLQARLDANVVVNPGRLGNAQGADRLLDKTGMYIVGQRTGQTGQSRMHPGGQVVDALEIFAFGDHRLTGGEQGFKPEFFVLPAGSASVAAFEVGRLDRTVFSDVAKQLVQVSALLAMVLPTPREPPVFAAGLVVAAMQGDVLHRYKTGFVGPGFKNMGAPQHHVQPLHRVVTDA